MADLSTKEQTKLAYMAEALIERRSAADFERIVEIVEQSANGHGLSSEFKAIIDVLRSVWEKFDREGPSREELVQEALRLTEHRGAERLAGVALAWAAENSYRRNADLAPASQGTAAGQALGRLEVWRAREAHAAPGH